MLKKFAFASLVASSAVFAGDFFVGVDVGSSKATFDGSTSGSVTKYGTTRTFNESTSSDDSGGAQGLKVGYYLNDNNRIYATAGRVNVEDAAAYNYGLSYDFLIGSSALKPFVGIGIGYVSVKTDDVFSGVLKKDSFDLSNMAYSARVGLNYKISKNLEAEASYQYSKVGGEDSSSYVAYPALNVKMELDKIASWQIGLNYRF